MPTEPPSLQHHQDHAHDHAHDHNHDHDQAQDHTEPPTETSQTLATTLITKCRALLGEINAFQTLLAQTLRNPQVVEVRSLRSSVVSELRTLEKLGRKVEEARGAGAGPGPAEAGDGDGSGTATPGPEIRLLHTLRSSNLPFYETVWAVAKGSCCGIAMFGKRFYWGKGEESEGSKWKKPNKDKRKSVLVDIAADDGEEWVKVSTISESRLLFEMAKKGWEGDESEEEGGRTVLRNTEGDGDDGDDEDEVELIKLARDMRRAADTTRVRYRRPRIRFVIPKIEGGKDGDIDRLLKEIRSYGITVDCGGQAFDQGVYRDTSELDLSHLLPNTFKRLTPTLNVDCTLLLAIVSDLSHSKDLRPSPIHHSAINRQIEIDKQQPLLPTELWPAMDARELICTEEAAQRMHDIVNVIGTDTEKERMRIMMGSPPFEHCDTASLVQKFQGLSDYQVPGHWKLPARIVEAMSVIESARQHGELPPVAEQVAKVLSDINYSVFLYGWSAGLTTISSNRTAVKQIELTVEKHRNGDQVLEGPPVWVCDTARSLIGKEKGRKD